MSPFAAGTRPQVVIPDDITGKYGGAGEELARLRAVADVVIHASRPTPADLAERLRDADIVLSFRPAFTRFPADVIAQCPRLRFICIAGAGVEDVDVAFASSRGIAVGNVVGSKRPVAEHCMALMFDLA
jgi:phosphoglycerate dehydrogenase-like enzyme